MGTNNNVPNTGFRYVVLTSTNPIVPGRPRQFIRAEAVA